MTARRALLDGLARDADEHLAGEGVVPRVQRRELAHQLEDVSVAADALDWCGARRADPLPLEGLRERFLPECTFRGRENTKLRYAVEAAAALHGGTEPDLLDEVAWCRPTTLAVRPVRGGRLHPRRRQPGGRPSAPGMPGPGRAPWPPGAITVVRDTAEAVI